jgi:glycine reductase
MSLKIGTFPVNDVMFGSETRWEDGVLTLNHDELLGLVREDPFLKDSVLELAKPGDSTRVINYQDVVEPRVKVDGPGQTYPGVAGRKVDKVGSGRTHRLGGFAITTCRDMSHLPMSEQLWPSHKLSPHPAAKEHFFDLSGPGANRPPYGTLHNLCLVVRSPDGLNGEERVTSVQYAALRMADRLARTTAELHPPELETIDLTPKTGKPNIAFAPHLASSEWELGARSPVGTGIYGMTRLNFPWVLDPTEVLDGAIFGGRSSWMMVNNPVIMAAARSHGQEVNFRACVVQRTNWTNENEKRLMASRLAHQLTLMDISGVIITTDVRGQRFVETILSVEACEKAGIKVVLLTEEEDNENGTAPPLLLTTPELRSAVSNGTGDVPTPFPPVETVVGTWNGADPYWFGELPPVHGRYGTNHFPDVYGYDAASYASY